MHLVCLAALAAAIPAPVAHVTVYSDRARVVRTAEIDLDGPRTVDLPLLDDSVDASTIQLEADRAQVQKIDIAHVDERDFPRGEARDLLAQIESLDDRIQDVLARRAARQKQLQALQQIAPAVHDEPLRALPKLTSQGWPSALAFVAAQMDKLQDEQRQGDGKLRELYRERDKLSHRATQIGADRRRTGHRVRATLNGTGTARLTLTYVALQARWFPSYDVQFRADQGTAQIAFSGLVSQETGEDWGDAQLTLSTAVPSASRVVPKLLSWKIGERDRFIPTPVPQQPPPVPPVPPVPLPLPRPREAMNDEQLRQKLLVAARSRPQDAAAAQEAIAEQVDAEVGAGALTAAPPPAVAAAPPAPVPSRRKSRAPVSKSAPPEPKESRSMGLAMPPPTADRPAPTPVAQVGLAPPPAYVPPSFSPEMPAGAAGGYDLAFNALRKETIKSGEGARRVPLFSESWPVKAERVVYPALAPDAAFLVAEIKNPSQRVFPGGMASLAVGADPAGQAQLKLVSPGETFTLPLGLDRAIKPIRNVNLVTDERGLFSKDEVTRYEVTIELANPYRQAIPIKVVDQVPLPANKDAELKLESAAPQPSKHDQKTGELQWALNLAPSSKQTVKFVYSLRRPKGYRLYQEQRR